MSAQTRPNKRRRLLLRWSGYSLVTLAVTSVVVAVASREKGHEVAAARAKVEGLTSVLDRGVASTPIRFEERAAEAGLTVRHFPGRRTSVLPEDMGSGIAVGDYDDDGDEDVFLVNFKGSIIPRNNASTAHAGRHALYRNNGDGGFTDVTDETGLGQASFELSAAWGDYDNDGDLDLYVTHYGPNTLYRNDGFTGGTPVPHFTDVTVEAGVGGDAFSAGCAWADYDRDGDLDLYVCGYVDFRQREGDRGRRARQYGSEMPYTLNPSSYDPVPNQLYRNNGDGTFTDVAAELGVADPDGRSLGVCWFDMDLDGWVDLYVANDVSHNAVFQNLGDGRFRNIGAESLAADYRGAMGLAVDDCDHDGDLDLLVTHWLAQENALFENALFGKDRAFTALPRGTASEVPLFFDRADRLGLGQSSLDMVGWAAGFVDFDNDGWNDLWIVNGSTMEEPSDHARLVAQPMLLYEHRADKGFFPIAAQACPALGRPFVGRGGVQADFDQDGRCDLLVLRFGDTPLYLRNTTRTDHHWIQLRLRQTGGNTHALGTVVRVTAGGVTRMAQVGAGPSYLSQHSDIVHIGLGPADRVDRVEVLWPDGAVETLGGLPVDRRVRLAHAGRYREAGAPAVARTGG